MQRSIRTLAALCLAALAPSVSGQIIVNSGFELTRNLSVPISTFAYLGDGRYIQYSSDPAQGQSFDLYAANGNRLANLGTLPNDVFPSFVVLDPSETFAFAGESSNGDLMTIDLAGGGIQVVANLPFNYDATFTNDGTAVYVSAPSIITGNDVVRLDVGVWTPFTAVQVSGFSGPVAIDGLGDLYYGATTPANVLRWTKAQLDSGTVLQESDATVFASGFDGILSMDVDPASNRLFVTNNNFNPGLDDSILELNEDGVVADVVAEGEFGVFLNGIQLVGGRGLATFHAYQPANVKLYYDSTDFSLGSSNRLTVEPNRATSTLTGPTSGPGAKTLTITDAEPSSAVLVIWGSQSDFIPSELQFNIGWGAPFHSALPIGAIRRGQFNTPTDASGTAVFQYYDPGNLHGTLVFQALVLRQDTTPMGSATAVLN